MKEYVFKFTRFNSNVILISIKASNEIDAFIKALYIAKLNNYKCFKASFLHKFGVKNIEMEDQVKEKRLSIRML